MSAPFFQLDKVMAEVEQMRSGWERIAHANTKLGWPPFADQVEFPTAIVRDLVTILHLLGEASPAPAPEFKCPACGATTRARMADQESGDSS